MATITEQVYQLYGVSREVSRPADLATLLLLNLAFDPPERLPAPVMALIRNLPRGELQGLGSGESRSPRATEFARWLYDNYLVINSTRKGVSFYPIHPVLALPGNGEGTRVRGFIEGLAACFAPEEQTRLTSLLWRPTNLPAFEQAVYELIEWQLPRSPVAPLASAGRFKGCDANSASLSADGIMARTKEDLMALAEATTGVQAFVAHGGRLLCLALSRYLLARAGVPLDLPIYAAPAADGHEGVRTLAHEIIDIHRAQFERVLHDQFCTLLTGALVKAGIEGDPEDEASARDLAGALFHRQANIIPVGEYERLRDEHRSFAAIAYHYYWSRSGAGNRFLRYLHNTHLNMAKKAGLANSRSRHSQWSFYWLAPSLVETLLLVSQSRLNCDRVLVSDLLVDWRDRYGIVMLIDEAWEDVYRRDFRGLGSPEVMNEANRRRFTEILAERGRLQKNSDDFPYVVLRD